MQIEIITEKVKIEDVRCGDIVKTFDVENKCIDYNEVMETHRPIVKKENQVKISSNESFFITSDWHPTLLYRNGTYGYYRADEVCIGDYLVSDDGLKSLVTLVEYDDLADEQFYDLTVDTNHNYYVTSDKNKPSFVIHNTMGLSDYLAKRNIPYVKSKEHVEELFENIAYYTINASISLAKERGKYPMYEGSDWSKGLILSRDREWYQQNTKDPERWMKTFDRLEKYGIRNSQLHMVAPNTSSSLVQGCSASVLPIFSKFYVDKNSKGAVPIMPPFIKDHFWHYQEFKNIPQKVVVDVVSSIQKWTDTGISMELIFNLNLENVNAKYMFETLVSAWEKEMKTIYYIRSIQKNSSDVSEKTECISCAG